MAIPLPEADEAALALELAVRNVPQAGAILDEQRARFTGNDRRDRFAFVTPAVSGDEDTRDVFFESLADIHNRRREPWVVDGLRYLNHPLRAPISEKYLWQALELLEDIQRSGSNLLGVE